MPDLALAKGKVFENAAAVPTEIESSLGSVVSILSNVSTTLGFIFLFISACVILSGKKSWDEMWKIVVGSGIMASAKFIAMALF